MNPLGTDMPYDKVKVVGGKVGYDLCRVILQQISLLSTLSPQDQMAVPPITLSGNLDLRSHPPGNQIGSSRIHDFN